MDYTAWYRFGFDHAQKCRDKLRGFLAYHNIDHQPGILKDDALYLVQKHITQSQTLTDEYLALDFDPSSYTVRQLQQVLAYHDIVYDGPRKHRLIETFLDNIYAMRAERGYQAPHNPSVDNITDRMSGIVFEQAPQNTQYQPQAPQAQYQPPPPPNTQYQPPPPNNQHPPPPPPITQYQPPPPNNQHQPQAQHHARPAPPQRAQQMQPQARDHSMTPQEQYNRARGAPTAHNYKTPPATPGPSRPVHSGSQGPQSYTARARQGSSVTPTPAFRNQASQQRRSGSVHTRPHLALPTQHHTQQPVHHQPTNQPTHAEPEQYEQTPPHLENIFFDAAAYYRRGDKQAAAECLRGLATSIDPESEEPMESTENPCGNPDCRGC